MLTFISSDKQNIQNLLHSVINLPAIYFFMRFLDLLFEINRETINTQYCHPVNGSL